jgi:hypothetical protein
MQLMQRPDISLICIKASTLPEVNYLGRGIYHEPDVGQAAAIKLIQLKNLHSIWFPTHTDLRAGVSRRLQRVTKRAETLDGVNLKGVTVSGDARSGSASF